MSAQKDNKAKTNSQNQDRRPQNPNVKQNTDRNQQNSGNVKDKMQE